MTRSRLLAPCLGILALAACSDDSGVGAAPPVAALRFINAVADTGAMDFRIVDIVGESPQLLENAFRAATPYQAVEAGARHVRVFLTPSRTDTLVGSAVVWDTTFDFVEGVTYSVIMTGYANPTRGVPLNMLITADDATAPAASQFGLRVINLGTGLGSVDAYSRRGTEVAPGTIFATDVAFGEVGAYGIQATGTDAYRLLVAPTATTTALADIVGPAGVAGTPSANPIAGTNVAGSVLTAIVVPASVPGTGAPAAFTTPSILFVADLRPAMTVP
jgi:hypothetical protein